jgi:hypothetical protein
LGEAQIQQFMRSRLTGNEAGLVAYYPFNEGTGSTTADGAPAGGNNNGLLNNGPVWLPAVETLNPSSVGASSATLHGVVSPILTNVTASFEWGTTTNYGNVTPPQLLGTNTAFSAMVTGLLSGATYYFRAVASNQLCVIIGADRTFTTTNFRPIVATLPATEVGIESARFNGEVNPQGANLVAGFEWGTSTNYGNVATVPVNSATTNVPYSVLLRPVQPSTTYHYRAFGSNAHGIAYGTNQTFTTLPPGPPVVTTKAA